MAKVKFSGVGMKRGFPIVLGLILLLSLFSSISPPTPAVASPDVVKWSRVSIPTEGEGSNWVLARGSDVQYLEMASDGSLYCYANPSGTNYTLFKSTDGGYSWSYIGRVKDNIVDIAAVPDDASVVYYATSSSIYKSTDGGSSFTRLPPNPGGAGGNNIEITSIDVAWLGSNYIIAVGTRDKDDSQYGGVYILDEIESPSWIDTSIGSYDVYAVAFPPSFATDCRLVAVVSSETGGFITTRVGDGGWGEIIGDAAIPVSNVVTADIAFPTDYDATTGHRVMFVAIDTDSGGGDVYMISEVAAPGSSVAVDLNIGFTSGLSNVDISTLAVTGDSTSCNLLAGAAGSAEVYFSTDGGTTWVKGSKPPTGGYETCVVMAPDFGSSGRAYAATCGTESALSYTADGGVTWNQIGLIDTAISNIIDLALSPGYSQDNNLFMVTWGGEHSLWRSLSGGAGWERVFTGALAYAYSFDGVGLSPHYGSSRVIFIAGISNGNPAIWKSTDNGQSFIRRNAPFPIEVWAVVNDDTLFVGGYDGSDRVVCSTTNSGWRYSTGAVAGTCELNSIVLSPNYEEDETILVGNTGGEVYWSNDNGISFERLGQQLPTELLPTEESKIAVAFDPNYSRNSTVYAASNKKATTEDKQRIYRFKVGTSTNWESIDSTLTEDSVIGQLKVSADGTLYATNSKADGGMERCLNPTYSLGPTFETVTRGLDDGAKLEGLWVWGNQLWLVDIQDTRLMTYADSLSQPVTLVSPPNQGQGVGIISGTKARDLVLEWEAVEGATKYRWQLSDESNFSSFLGYEGDSQVASVRLPELEPATTYYWRVKAIEPVLSPWSSKWRFTTSLGQMSSTFKLYSPEAGASGVPLKPIFQWSAITGAERYELLVSSDISFANPIIIKIGAYALSATAWQCDLGLDYDTTYYWKVRAAGSDSYSAWSAVSAFTTESEPSLEPAPLLEPPPSLSEPPPSSSEPSPPLSEPPPLPVQQTTPEWVKWLMYLGGALLLTMLVVLITMIMLVVRVWQR